MEYALKLFEQLPVVDQAQIIARAAGMLREQSAAGTGLQIFENPIYGRIRTTVDESGQPLFVAADLCRALEIANHKDAVKRLDEDEKLGVVLTDPHGRPQQTTCVTESGFYSLVLGSRKKEARAFKRWVTHEVLPAIRRTGGYQTRQADTRQYERMLAETEDRRSRLAAAAFWERHARRYGGRYRQTLEAYAMREMAGEFVLPPPESEAGHAG